MCPFVHVKPGAHNSENTKEGIESISHTKYVASKVRPKDFWGPECLANLYLGFELQLPVPTPVNFKYLLLII